MKKTFIAILTLAILLLALMFIFSQAPQPSKVELVRQEVRPPRRAGEDARDGASSYKFELALAQQTSIVQSRLFKYESTPGLAGRSELDEIYAAGVPKTPEAARKARQILSTASPDEKIALARILGSLYTRENSTGYNTELALDLKALAADTNKDVSRIAASAFARLGYMPGSETVLEGAFKSGAMASEEYMANFLTWL